MFGEHIDISSATDTVSIAHAGTPTPETTHPENAEETRDHPSDAQNAKKRGAHILRAVASIQTSTRKTCSYMRAHPVVFADTASKLGPPIYSNLSPPPFLPTAQPLYLTLKSGKTRVSSRSSKLAATKMVSKTFQQLRQKPRHPIAKTFSVSSTTNRQVKTVLHVRSVCREWE